MNASKTKRAELVARLLRSAEINEVAGGFVGPDGPIYHMSLPPGEPQPQYCQGN